MYKKSVLLAPNKAVKLCDPVVRYPAYASPKLDGIRFCLNKGEWLTRTMKPQPNKTLPYVFKELTELSRNHSLVFDGELFNPHIPFNEIQKIILSHYGEIDPGFSTYIFDGMTVEEWENPTWKFSQRVDFYKQKLFSYNPNQTIIIPQEKVNDSNEASDLLEEYIKQGHEGLMLRCPNAIYKHGRATLKQGMIFKFKEWFTLDGEIIGFNARRKMVEGLVREKNELGRTKRTHKKEHYVEDEDLGSFRVRLEDGSETDVGPGANTEAWRRDIWKNRSSHMGRFIEFKYMEAGKKDSPRFPQFLRFRDDKTNF